jgi:hypothetical protein
VIKVTAFRTGQGVIQGTSAGFGFSCCLNRFVVRDAIHLSTGEVKKMICPVTDENLAEVRAFLEQYSETALFLLSNLETHGPSLSEELDSGNFKCLKSPEGLQGVFCLTRRGRLVAQTEGDRTDEILEACQEEEILIEGVLGEWETAASRRYSSEKSGTGGF